MWTREEFARAQYLRNQGMTHREIAEQMDYQPVQIRKWFSREYDRERRLERAGRKEFSRNGCAWTNEEIIKAVRMFKDGADVETISKAMSRSQDAISAFLRKSGHSLKKPITERPVRPYEVLRIAHENIIERNRSRENTLFLIDLLKASGFRTMGEAKAAYVQKNELAIDEGAARHVPMTWFSGSCMGSVAAMCAE